MNQELTKEIGLEINSYYEKLVATLLDPCSYSNKPSTENVSIYLSFVEAALEKPYSRIVHLQAFLDSAKTLMIDRMYPFCYLLDSAKEKIKIWRYQSEWLMDGLEELDPKASEVLGIEPHELLES